MKTRRREIRAQRKTAERERWEQPGMAVACILEQDAYKPGDPAPSGYLAWHEWAEAQHKAGLRQEQCGKCGLWRYPQELSGETIKWQGFTASGRSVNQAAPLCLKCMPPKPRASECGTPP